MKSVRREIEKKDISKELREVMEGLIKDHVFGRKTCRRLADANLDTSRAMKVPSRI